MLTDGIHRALLNLVSNAVEACADDLDRSKQFDVVVRSSRETDEGGERCPCPGSG
jgi:nitrogen-specific signal transduction histidine kinase